MVCGVVWWVVVCGSVVVWCKVCDMCMGRGGMYVGRDGMCVGRDGMCVSRDGMWVGGDGMCVGGGGMCRLRRDGMG